MPWLLSRLAISQFAAKDFASARATYEELAGLRSAPKELREIATLNQCRCLEAAGNYRDAAAAYRKAVDESTGAFVKIEGLLDQARCLRLANDREGAVKIYDEARLKAGEIGYPRRSLPDFDILITEARLSPETYGDEEPELTGPPVGPEPEPVADPPGTP